MKKNVLLLTVLCVLLSGVSLAVHGNTLSTTQSFAARDRDRDGGPNKNRPPKKQKDNPRPRAHNKH
jgi:hypothetical protein